MFNMFAATQNGYLVGMWINIVQVGPCINGAGILSFARENIQSTLTKFHIISTEIRRAHTGDKCE